MNYYIQGDSANADKIKAAFQKLGYDISWPEGCANPDVINIGVERNGAKYVVAETSEYIKDIIKTHPNYKELELPLEPNFKVGDWVVTDYGKVSQVVSVDKDGDGYTLDDGVYFSGSWCDMYHRWTIADAKDGDVLVTTKVRSCPFIYRKTSSNNGLAYYYAGIDGDGNFREGCIKRTLYHFGPVSNVAPATKEQRDLLFAKLMEAGYQWDAGKKELRRRTIEPTFKVGDEIFRHARNEYFKIKGIEKDSDTVWYVTTRTRIADNDKHIGEVVRINAFYQDGYSIAPNTHYGISNFHEGMPVLVRNGDCLEWEYVTFSHYRKVGIPFCAGGQYWYQCIPFSEETKHLLGTSYMPSEEFINW